MNRWLVLAFALTYGAALSAQEAQPPADTPPQVETPTDRTSNPLTLAEQPTEPSLHNYLNFYGFLNGVYDSTFPVYAGGQFNNAVADQGAFGFEVGGGLTAFHELNHGTFDLSYRGGYRDYRGVYPSGTDQNLSLDFRKALTKRWGISFSQSAGIFLNGGTYFSLQPSQSGAVELNPYTNSTKYLSSNLGFSYQQSIRLSYEFGGSFFLSRYGGAAPFGTTGGSGFGSVLYRFTRRTTASATYSRGYTVYQGGGGEAGSDTGYVTLSHDFSAHWQGGISAGVNRVHSTGTAFLPFDFQINDQAIQFYIPGKYDQTSMFPYFQASLTRSWRRSRFTVNAGQNVNSGNGIFLASRNDFANGFYSYANRKWNIGFGGNYSRLTSVSNTVSAAYSSLSLSGSMGYSLMRHLGANLRYDYADYGSFGTLGGRIDNRVSFGFTISSKNVPATLF